MNAALFALATTALAQAPQSRVVTVRVAVTHAINSFDPDSSLGSSIDVLSREPQLMKHILQVWRDDGVSRNVPLMVTESHLSWSLTGLMPKIFGALWLADNVGSFFEGGGAAVYHSPIQPQGVQNTCLGWASWSNFVSDETYTIKGYTATYYAAHMLNLEWLQHRAGFHQMFPSSSDLADVTSYAVLRPDGNWSLMLANRDSGQAHAVQVVFDSKG